MKILLREKLRLVIFGLLLVIAIGFLASRTSSVNYGAGGILSADNLSGKTYAKALNNVTKKDSDRDGLKDWEEELWGTDPNNSDTDEDGTKDGEEVDAGRNPNLAGPDDELDKDILISHGQDATNENLTETEKFAQNFFGNYLSKRASSDSLTENDKNELVSSALENISNLEFQVQQYTISDLLISNDLSKTSVRNYGNTIGEIILKHSFKTDNELTIFNRSLADNDKEGIKKLDPIINGYNNILKDALVVAVPQDAAEEHLEFIYSVASIISSIEDMREIHDDPIRAIMGMEKHRQSAILLTNAFDSMKSYFKDKDIVFSEEEPGIILTNLI